MVYIKDGEYKMIVLNQKVKVRWNGNNKKIYESKGYIFTHNNDQFYVDIKDVPSTSHYEVEFKCDFCGGKFTRNLNHVHNREKHYCSDLCKERGSNPNGLTNEERLYVSIENLKILKEKLSKIPTVVEYDKFAKENGLFTRRVIQAKLNKNWNELCDEIFGNVNVQKRTKEQMLNELINLKDKLGRTPLTIELNEYGLCDFNTYQRKFNMTFNELVRSLGWETNGNFTKELKEEYLLEQYYDLYKKLNRVPLRYDIENEKDFPCYETFMSKFSSLSNICNTLDIQIGNDELNSVGFGISLIDKNNDFCRSIPEMMITNMLIDNEIKYIKEYHYNKVIKSDKSKRRFDWYLSDLNICIEYFGMFEENSNNEIFIKYNKKVYQKIKVCEKNNINLIDIYKEDLENNFSNIINKFNKFGINLVV
jgi:predicted metal-dependent hydrolase